MVLYSCIFMQLLKQVFDTAYSVLLVTEAQCLFITKNSKYDVADFMHYSTDCNHLRLLSRL